MSSRRDEIYLERQRHTLTVGTIAAPNLANKGKSAGKSIPLSQISTPPVIDPEFGFTSVRVGRRSSSILGGGIASELEEPSS